MDIISKRWSFITKTLADRISGVKIKKASVKAPKFRTKIKKIIKTKKDSNFPVSSIVNILIKAAVEKAKTEKKTKIVFDAGKTYILPNTGKEPESHGGYGTVSKSYGASPNNSYVDYEKLFSYLGKFKSQSAYENMGSRLETLNKATESGSFVLADRDAMDKIGRFDKYMKSPVMDMPIMALSLVPIAGLSSGEWEEIKNLMRFDSVMYTLKSKIS